MTKQDNNIKINTMITKEDNIMHTSRYDSEMDIMIIRHEGYLHVLSGISNISYYP